MHKQYYKLSGAQYATTCILTKRHVKLFSSLLFMLLIDIKCWLTWQEVEHKRTTYLGNLNEAGNNKQQFRKIPICIFRIWYYSSLDHMLELLNMQSNATMLNYAFFHPIYI